MKDLIDIVIIQETMGDNLEKNINKIYSKISLLDPKNTTIVTLHELCYLKYIPITKVKKKKSFAININSDIIKKFCDLSKVKKIYILFPFFESLDDKFYNSLILISPTGKVISIYRKRNIPSEPCYEEDYYFSSSRNQFPVTKIGKYNIGLMICWDQWYSESYNSLLKKNVDLILCPTSIGFAYSNDKKISLPDEKHKWLKTITSNSFMINTPVVVTNRIGVEYDRSRKIRFWGNSFITNANGDIEYKSDNKKVLHKHTIDLSKNKKFRELWNFR
jgi:N-carbamoylputrescine amidase